MPTASLNSPVQRIGRLKGELLLAAMPHEVLSLGVGNKQMPKNGGKTMIYRRWLPFGAAATNANTINRWSVDYIAHITQEGVTPNADSLTPQDVEVQMQQFSCLYQVTDQLVDLHEDGAQIPQEMKDQTGERMGLVREMLRYGVLKAGTLRFFAGGTSRGTVDETISLNLLRKVTRNLKANHTKTVTSVLTSDARFGTQAVEASYLVFCSTDMEHDIRSLPGFKETVDYGQRRVLSEHEIGSCENYRFILSAELSGIPDSGAAVGATGLFSTTGSNLDVYPIIVMGKDAAYDVALRGTKALDPTWLPPGQKDKNDPLGQRGYIGAKFYSAAFIGNNGWMAVVESAITAL